MAHQELALHALIKGIDLIPDKVWDKIPGMKEKERPKGKEETYKDEKIESRRSSRRDSETTKSRSSRDSDRFDEYGRDRRERRRRATMDSPYDSDLQDESDYHRERGRRSRDYDNKRRSADYINRPPPSYMNGVPFSLHHPASYPTAGYGQPIPFAYAAVPPINTVFTNGFCYEYLTDIQQQIPYAAGHPASYAHPQSAGSSRSTSNAPPMWSNDASRRSSVYSNNNYTPPTDVSPKLHPYSQPPPQAYQTHPAYTNGSPPHEPMAFKAPQDQHSAAQSVASKPRQPSQTYARAPFSQCPTCGHSLQSSPVQLPHPQPQHTLSFPFLASSSQSARNPHPHSPNTQILNTLPSSTVPTPFSLSASASRRNSVADSQRPAITSQQRRGSSGSVICPAQTRVDVPHPSMNTSSSSLSRSSSTKAQVGGRPSSRLRHQQQQKESSVAREKLSERLEEAIGNVADRLWPTD